MREQDAPLSFVSIRKTESSRAGRSFVVKNGYKLWVIAAILLLALWSMFTGSVTLRRFAGNIAGLSDDLSIPSYEDLDILEVEDREQVVRHLWDLYTKKQSGGSTSRLPRFWQEAFEAAYDSLSSDAPTVRNAAVSEIAKMSIRAINVVDPFPLQSKGIKEVNRKIKATKEGKDMSSNS